MDLNVRESMPTTAIRIVKDAARLTAMQAVQKTLQLISLLNADSAIGSKAHAASLGRESFPELFNSVDDLERQMDQKREPEPTPTKVYETFVGRTKRFALEGKKRLNVEILLHKRKNLLAKNGRSLRDSDLASAEAIKDEIANARDIVAKVSALGKEIDELSALQPRWVRTKLIVVTGVVCALLITAYSRPQPRAGLHKSMAQVRAKFTSDNEWKWTAATVGPKDRKSFKGSNPSTPWMTVQLLGTEAELDGALVYPKIDRARMNDSGIIVGLTFATVMCSYFNGVDNTELAKWMANALKRKVTNPDEKAVRIRNGLTSALTIIPASDATLVLLTIEPTMPPDEI